MAVKVQFNPSTLKVLFNPTTQKVLVVKTGGGGSGDDCQYCPTPSETPAQIEVTFSGIVECPGCCWRGPSMDDDWFQWNMPVSLNRTWLINQHSQYPCTWERTIVNAIRTERWHATYVPPWTCDYLLEAEDCDAHITIIRGISTYTIVIKFQWTEKYWPYGKIEETVFDGGDITPDTGHCLKKNSISNTLSCGAGGAPPSGGTADIVEL